MQRDLRRLGFSMASSAGFGSKTLWYTAGRLNLPASIGRSTSGQGRAKRRASRKKDNNER